MQIKVDKLRKDLQNRQFPLYLVCGDEPLQYRESVDMLRRAAKYYAYEEREVYAAEAGFDWDVLTSAAHAMSLFASKKLIELHLPSGKPGDKGARALIEYAENPPDDTILLILTGKLESSAKKTKWYKALDQTGAIIQVWPLSGKQLNAWLRNRCRKKGLNLTNDALQLVNERIEGNLLAADQEIEKLSLLYPGNGNATGRSAASVIELNREMVAQAVFDSARYNVFELFDCALSGDLGRTSRMLNGLRQEGTAIMLLLSLVAKETRMLAKMSALTRQQNLEKAMQSQYVYPQRKGLIAQALQQTEPLYWQELLQKLLEADKMVKGLMAGDPWEQLMQILAQVANKPYLFTRQQPMLGY